MILLHSNKGTGHYTVRSQREIVAWLGKKPLNAVIKDPVGKTYLVTKATFKDSRKLGRVVLKEYAGKWPRCALVWQVIKEFIND